MDTKWMLVGLEQIATEIRVAEDAPDSNGWDLASLGQAYNKAREQLRAADPDALAAWEMGVRS